MFEVEITTSNLKKFCPCRLTKAQKVSRLNIASHLSFHSQVEATNVLTHCHLALPPLWFKGIWREEFLLSAIHSHPSTLLPAGSRSVGRSYIRVKNAGRTRSFGVNVANVVYTIYIFEFEHIYIIYSTIQTCNVYPWPCQKKMSCTSVPPIPSLKWLKQTDTIGMLCRIFQQSLTFQAMRQHVLAAQHDLHWSADHRGRPVFLVNPLFIIVQRRAVQSGNKEQL